MRFLHTADWQIGKPFQSIEDPAKRESLRQQRVETIRRLRAVIETEKLEFVLVCGDLFDSATPDKATVSALCSAVGSLEVPVYAIPGNHDHGGPGCIWEQAFFLREQDKLAPNFHILLKPEPLILEDAVLLPCPLERRHVSGDPTRWLQTAPEALPTDRPWIVLAHGSTQGFSSAGDEDKAEAINQIDLSKLPFAAYDYIALGDWHGMKQIQPNAWFSGTPEQDRFAKGSNNQPGHALIVDLTERGRAPAVTPVPTGCIGWHEPDAFQLMDDAALDSLESQLDTLLGNRTSTDLLKLTVSGTLSLAGGDRFDALVQSLRARLIRLRLQSQLTIEPSEAELDALTQRQDPLIAQVACELRDRSDPLARQALRELHIQCLNAAAPN